VRACGFTSLLAVVLVSVVAASAAVGATRTTAPAPYVSIHVTLADSKVVLSPTREPRGSIARFIIQNAGTNAMTFNVGAETADRTKGFGFTEVVGPRQRRVRLLYLVRRGPLPYYVGSSYSGAKATQRGALQIGDACTGCPPPGVLPSP
jgi:hypothetical protein